LLSLLRVEQHGAHGHGKLHELSKINLASIVLVAVWM
jgi:hypothetical protein